MLPHFVTTGMSVLIADDDPVFRSLAVSRLIALDARLLEAGDGAEAWEIARANKLDLALIDFEMPIFDGLALTQVLRAHPATRHIPIIMCTSHSQPEMMQAAIEAGVSSFLTKPVNWSLFERHIRHLLQMSHSAAELAAHADRLEMGHAEKDALVSDVIAELRAVLAGEAGLLKGTDGRLALSVSEKLSAFAQAYELLRRSLPNFHSVHSAQ